MPKGVASRKALVKEGWELAAGDAPEDSVKGSDGAEAAELPLRELRLAQESDAGLWELLNFLRRQAGLKEAEPVAPSDETRLRAVAGKYVLGPEGELRRVVHLPLGPVEVPVLPPSGGWRQWAFQRFHDAPMAGHLSASKTVDKLRRVCFWERMVQDAEYWVSTCEVCARHRRTGMPLPSDVKLPEHTLGPWMDVYIDFVGPYPESVDGYKYACTYTCKFLRVPIIQPARSLTRGDAMQAVMACMLQSLTIPATWRHDLGRSFPTRCSRSCRSSWVSGSGLPLPTGRSPWVWERPWTGRPMCSPPSCLMTFIAVVRGSGPERCRSCIGL